MRKILLCLTLVLPFVGHAQDYAYAPSRENPYGLPNPKGPRELLDFKEMIGTCTCRSVTRIDQTRWADTVSIIWTFKYIMNGMAIQDETYKGDGLHSGSLRQFNTDSSRWYVHYYATAIASPVLPTWEGSRMGNKIVLYRPQASPNGVEGYYRLTFYEISRHGYNWIGEWVDKQETVSYPTWKIFCKKS